MKLKVKIKRLRETAYTPQYAKAGDSGFDLRADISATMTVAPMQTVVIPTGLVFGVPAGFEMQVRSRSGLAAKHSVSVLNAPGTIDSGYRDEVKVIFINLGSDNFRIDPQDRIAQGVIAPVFHAEFEDYDTLDEEETERGKGGFGHSGVK